MYLCCHKTYPLLGNVPISEIWPRKCTHIKSRKRTGYVFWYNYGRRFLVYSVVIMQCLFILTRQKATCREEMVLIMEGGLLLIGIIFFIGYMHACVVVCGWLVVIVCCVKVLHVASQDISLF